MQDGYNLIWKLALVEKGLAYDKLLDTYHSERYPIGKSILKKTDIMTKMILIKNPLLISLRNVLIRLISSINLIKKWVIRDLAELKISYPLSPIVKILGTKTRFKVGEYIPNFALKRIPQLETVQLHHLIQGTKHHCLLFAGLKQGDSLLYLLETTSALQERFNDLLEIHLVLTGVT